jgi:two-component system nitrate/nitrite response regulator NarL
MTVTAVAPSEPTSGANEGPRAPRAPRSPRGSPLEFGAGGVQQALEPSPRVVIADRNPAVRFGIRLALERAGFLVVAEAGTGEDAGALAAAFEPDVCLVDVDIDGGGIAAARTIGARVPGTAVVMLSATANEDDLLAAIRAGASGYLLKTMNPERLPVAVRGVLAGEAAIPRALGGRLFAEIRGGGNTAAPPSVRGDRIPFTPGESQVVQLMREDRSTREIAARLGISDATVRRHVSAALRKLAVPDRRAAVSLLQRSQTMSGRRFVR